MPFTWDESARRYRDDNGALVPSSAVRSALDTVVARSGDRLRALTTQLRQGDLDIPAWQQQVQAEVKSLHLATAAVSRGGWAQMTYSDFGWTGQRLRGQYAYLRQFAVDVASGKQPINGTLEARAALYAEAARSTAREMERRLAMLGGHTEEKNVLGAADHCGGSPSCLGETAKGWVAIGTLVAVGSRACHSRCRCHLEFRALDQVGDTFVR